MVVPLAAPSLLAQQRLRQPTGGALQRRALADQTVWREHGGHDGMQDGRKSERIREPHAL